MKATQSILILHWFVYCIPKFLICIRVPLRKIQIILWPTKLSIICTCWSGCVKYFSGFLYKTVLVCNIKFLDFQILYRRYVSIIIFTISEELLSAVIILWGHVVFFWNGRHFLWYSWIQEPANVIVFTCV